jgi:hypothetical protein
MIRRFTVSLSRGSFIIDEQALDRLLAAIDNGQSFVTLPIDVIGDGHTVCDGIINLSQVISILPIATRSVAEVDPKDPAEVKGLVLAFPNSPA